MNIALMNTRIAIQVHRAFVDSIGNHINGWNSYFDCYATVSGSSGGGQMGGQDEAAGQTTDHSGLSFTIRYCERLKALNCTEYRVYYEGQAYDIVSIDWMNMRKKCIKLKCRRCVNGR